MHSIKIPGAWLKPTKIVCVGRNYHGHIRELGNETPEQLVVFLKPNSALTNQLSAFSDETLHYEAELCFVVVDGRYRYIGVGLDLTKRKLQSQLKSKGLPWERAKAFDGSALFSAFVPIPSELDDLSFELKIDSELKQSGSIDKMIFKPHEILSELREVFTLEDGDIVMTGTPEGVGEIRTNQIFELTLLSGGQTLVTQSWVAQ